MFLIFVALEAFSPDFAAPQYASGNSQTCTAPSQNLTITIATNWLMYAPGDAVSYIGIVTSSGAPVEGATVFPVIRSPTYSVTMVSATTSSQGRYLAHYTISTSAPVGAWTVTVTTTVGGLSCQVSLGFTVSSPHPITQTVTAVVTQVVVNQVTITTTESQGFNLLGQIPTAYAGALTLIIVIAGFMWRLGVRMRRKKTRAN